MWLEKSAEAILRLKTITEGPNSDLRCSVYNCEVIGGIEKMTEMSEADYFGIRRNWRER
jgi:hypothetical protein